MASCNLLADILRCRNCVPRPWDLPPNRIPPRPTPNSLRSLPLVTSQHRFRLHWPTEALPPSLWRPGYHHFPQPSPRGALTPLMQSGWHSQREGTTLTTLSFRMPWQKHSKSKCNHFMFVLWTLFKNEFFSYLKCERSFFF